MKKITAILGVLAAVASLSLADSGPEASAKDTKKVVQNNFVETAQKGIKLSGYVDAGYSYNFTGQGNQSTVNSRFSNDTAQQGDFNLYALKLALEKALTSENKAQAGFRADVIIGEDATFLANRDQNGDSSVSNNDQNSNALFLEQAYASIRAPVGNGWDFKVGKFVSILGYEVIERPANMNTTYGLLWNQFPLYYTGVLSSYKFDDYLDGKLGVVNGSNTDNNTTTFPNAGDGVAVLAALNVTAPGGNANWSNNFQYSTNVENNTSNGTSASSLPFNDLAGINDAQNNGGTLSNNGWYGIFNSWGNWAPKFADDKLLFAFDSVLGFASGKGTFNDGNQAASFNYNSSTTWYGAGAYAKYQFNDWFYLASRGEYLGSNNSYKFGTQGAATTSSNVNGSGEHVTGGNWWEYTITAGFNVIDNLLIRGEYRLDWGSNIQSNTATNVDPNGSASGGPAHYAGAEVVYSF